jgi:5-methylcytosine-specific restriction endonuclease McrA
MSGSGPLNTHLISGRPPDDHHRLDPLMYPKPTPQRRIKAKTDRQNVVARAKCVAAVWKRDNRECQHCGYWLYKHTETDQVFKVGHVHEIVPRSRGGDPHDPANCLLLCPQCHAKAHSQHVGH